MDGMNEEKLLIAFNPNINMPSSSSSSASSDLFIPARGPGRAAKEPTLIEIDRVVNPDAAASSSTAAPFATTDAGIVTDEEEEPEPLLESLEPLHLQPLQPLSEHCKVQLLYGDVWLTVAKFLDYRDCW